MPTSIVHLADDDTPAESYPLINMLCTRGGGEFEQSVIVLGSRALWQAERWLTVPARRCPLRFTWPVAWAPGLAGLLRGRGAGLVQAWGVAATEAAGLAASTMPLVATALPTRTRALARWVRTADNRSPHAVACESQIICRRCLAAGASPQRCVVIRPGVDFGLLAEARRTARREYLGLPGDAPLLLTLPIRDRQGGHAQAIWATAMLQQLSADIRLILPGVGREQRRLARFSHALDRGWMTVWPQERWSWPQLLAVADALVVPAEGDFDTTLVCWAMAASVGVIGSAGPALVEFIAEARNGLLCQPGNHVDLARKVRRFLSDRELRLRLTDAARAQAYEVFSVQRCVENYGRLWSNLLAGQSPSDGVQDAALAS